MNDCFCQLFPVVKLSFIYQWIVVLNTSSIHIEGCFSDVKSFLKDSIIFDPMPYFKQFEQILSNIIPADAPARIMLTICDQHVQRVETDCTSSGLD